MTKKLTILLTPLRAHGHVNPSLGLGQVLRERGHRVVFAVDVSFKGKLSKEGFEEYVHCPTPDEDFPQDLQQWYEVYSHVFRLSPIETMEGYMLPAMNRMTKVNMLREEQYREIIDKIKPDLIIVDNLVYSVTQISSGIPWVWAVWSNPLLAIVDQRAPPGYSGLSTKGPKEEWDQFRNECERIFDTLKKEINQWAKSRSAVTLSKGELHPYSPYLNLYMFPKELDYEHLRPLPPKWHRIDYSILSTDEQFSIPEVLKNKCGKLIYVSMGSIACHDLSLMTRLVNLLKDSPHRFIFSKGSFGDKYQLSDNMWGDKMLPQTKVIPLMDLVITHGGNNTVTEILYYGKPMIVMPVFADQYDNAQRIDEMGYGIRLDTFNCTKEQLLHTIEKVLSDKQMEKRLRAASQRIQSSKSMEYAANLIENIIK